MGFESNLRTFQKLQKVPCFYPSEVHRQAGVHPTDFGEFLRGIRGFYAFRWLPAFSAFRAFCRQFAGSVCFCRALTRSPWTPADIGARNTTLVVTWLVMGSVTLGLLVYPLDSVVSTTVRN